MKTFLKLCALALVVAFPQFAPGATPLKVGMVEWVAYSPLNVAEHQRFWGDLDVSVIVFGSNTELNAALTNGRIDVALDMLGSWVGLQQTGTPLVLLGETDWSNGGDKVILGKGISPADLVGKPIGIYLDQPSVTFFSMSFSRRTA